MRGRVLSLWQLAFQGTTPIGGPLIGWVIAESEPRIGLVVGAATCLIAAGLGAAIARHRLSSAHAPDAVALVAEEATTRIT
jgi:MFS family permease